MFSLFKKRKKDLLLKKIGLQREEAHKNGRFSMFDIGIINENMNYDSLRNMYTILNSWESSCNIPYSVGESLITLMKDNTVMIHRTNLGLDINQEGLDFNDDLIDIMSNGLKNQGHINAAGGGAFTKGYPPLTLTMTSLEGLSGFINLVSSYKENDTIIITAFPKDLVNKEGNLVQGHNYSEIYELDDNIPRVKNQYMVGAILKKKNRLDEFYTRDEIIKTNDKIKSAK